MVPSPIAVRKCARALPVRGGAGRAVHVALVAGACLAAACATPRAAVPRDAPSPLPSKPIAFAILEDYDVGDDLADVARDFALFRELGVDTWRGSISWLQVEPARGAYDFAWLRRFAELAHRERIRLRPYVDYTPAWAARGGGSDGQEWNDPPASLDAWGDLVRALAGALRAYPNVLSLEIYNEENSTLWWDGTVDAYDSVLTRAAHVIREAHPGTQVLLGGLVWPDARWLGAACATPEKAARFDVVPIHAYPETWTPESVHVENYLRASGWASFREVLHDDCGGKPVWIDELGFATVDGKSERDQAEWWARAIATYLAVPEVQEIGIYEIKDARRDRPVIGDAPNYHLGITYTDRRPKLAFRTLQRLVALLDVGHLTIADDSLGAAAIAGSAVELHHHAFIRPDGGQVVFVWDRRGSPTVRLTLPRRGRTATEYALDGTGTPYASFDGRVLDGVRLAPGEVRVFNVAP